MPARDAESRDEAGRIVDPQAETPAVPVGAIRLSTFATQTAICLAIVGCCVSMAMPVAHLVAHASDLGHATARAAEMLAIALLVSTVIRLVAGALVVDRFGGLVALLVFSGLQTAAMLLYAVVDGMLALYTVSVLFGLGYGGVNICYPVLVREHLPRADAGRRLGVILLFGTFGMALGGWLAGYVFDATGSYTPAFLVGAAFNVANLIIVLGLISPGASRGRRTDSAGPGVSGGPDDFGRRCIITCATRSRNSLLSSSITTDAVSLGFARTSGARGVRAGETRTLMGVEVSFFTEIVRAGPVKNCEIQIETSGRSVRVYRRRDVSPGVSLGRWRTEPSLHQCDTAPALNTPAAAQTGGTSPRATPPCAGTSGRRTGVR